MKRYYIYKAGSLMAMAAAVLARQADITNKLIAKDEGAIYRDNDRDFEGISSKEGLVTLFDVTLTNELRESLQKRFDTIVSMTAIEDGTLEGTLIGTVLNAAQCKFEFVHPMYYDIANYFSRAIGHARRAQRKDAMSFVLGYLHNNPSLDHFLLNAIDEDSRYHTYRQISALGQANRDHIWNYIESIYRAEPQRLVRFGAFEGPLINIPIELGYCLKPEIVALHDFVAVYTDVGGTRKIALHTESSGLSAVDLVSDLGGRGNRRVAYLDIDRNMAPDLWA